MTSTISNVYGSIPEPMGDPESLRQAVVTLKHAVEVLTRQRKPASAAAVTWQDLVDLELIDPSQIPAR